ncbi:hypothetical protein ACIU1J_24160 [Azospirillum doebereinerae]|uniref:hypothetical protein n=1 Tax=Azospirillum doebereinerae TaxID=92933 RepID=UPI001EE596F7|nr:hypothetical protein [Azospirillum doebereinerae]MCG5242922.1 hypothetical protein [Azospirillum doebereinerae]
MNIIQAVLAVALMAMAVAGGIQYVNPNAATGTRLASQADAGFSTLESAFRSRQAGGATGPAAEAWQAALFPAYGSPPAAVAGLSWSYGVEAAGVWFCLSGPLSRDPVKQALTALATRRPQGLYDVTRSCGGGGGPPEGTIAATLWMQRTTP